MYLQKYEKCRRPVRCLQDIFIQVVLRKKINKQTLQLKKKTLSRRAVGRLDSPKVA